MAGKYRDMVLRGVPVTGLDVVDAHNHLGPYFNFPVHRGGSAESMIERAVTTGVGIMCVSANAAIGPDMRLGNDEAEAAVRAGFTPMRRSSRVRKRKWRRNSSEDSP